MGMYYRIETDVELDDNGDLESEVWNLTSFPGQLSHFFDQIGGYGHCSEVSQVSKILNIDLSLFQVYDFEDNPESEKTWQTIESVISKTEEFENAMQNNPQFYKEVKHRPDNAPREEDWTDVNKLIENIQNSILGKPAQETSITNDWNDKVVLEKYCPQDDGYLSSGDLHKDIQTLKQNLKQLKDIGVQKIKLHYG